MKKKGSPVCHDRNGIPFLKGNYYSEMKKGCNTCQCSPPVTVTSSSRQARTGVTLGRYRDIWPPVKGTTA